MWPAAGLQIEIKTPEQFNMMRAAGLVMARAIEVAVAAVRPGVSTAELDALAEREITRGGRHAVLQGLPRVSRHAVHVGERRDRARHPEAGPAAGRG